MKNVIDPYVWLKAQVVQGPEPFIDLSNILKTIELKNIIGKDDENKKTSDSKYLNLVRGWLNRYFRTRIVKLSDVPMWIDVTGYDYKNCKLHIDLNELRDAVHNFESYPEPGGDLLQRQIDFSPVSVNTAGVVAKIPVAQRKHIMSPTQAEWLIRACRLWIQQAETYRITEFERFKPFITNVVGGPRIKTKSSKNGGGYYTSGTSLLVVELSKWDAYKKTIKYVSTRFKRLLIHEYTHFLQELYVKATNDVDSSYWDSAPLSNPAKYYRSMWERDAYAVEFLYDFIRKKGYDIEALVSGYYLGSLFDAGEFKEFLRHSGDYHWHAKRMADKDADERWLNGLVYGAAKFVADITANSDVDSSDIEIKPNYRAVVSMLSPIAQFIIKAHEDTILEVDSDDEEDVDLSEYDIDDDLEADDESYEDNDESYEDDDQSYEDDDQSYENNDESQDDNDESQDSDDQSQFDEGLQQMQDPHPEMKDVPVEEVMVGDENNINKYQGGVQVSLETPRWSSDEIKTECMKLNIKHSPALEYCANVEGITYHCGLSDAIKSASLYVD